MRKFKQSHKILFAALALFLAICLASGSTFAWFSMNTGVTETGMNIEVKSDSIYLLISQTNTTASAIQTEHVITVNLATIDNTPLYPTAHGTVGAAPTYTVTPITAGTGVTNFSWYTMNGTDAATATGLEKSARQISNEDVNQYVLKYTLYFTLAVGSNEASDLHVSSCTITGDTSARCLVVGASNSVEFAATDADGDATVLAAALTDDTVVSVDVYVFYDGNASNINTNNIANVADTTIDLGFTVTAA